MMLLRRITQHVSNQNWFAVFIDFVIVVVGVFIGIQVANWNENRENQIIEQDYYQRLHAELKSAIASTETLMTVIPEELNLLYEVSDYITDRKPDIKLNQDHCTIIGRSHIYNSYAAIPPTIQELYATGRFSLIKEPEIRDAIGLYVQEIDGNKEILRSITENPVRLSQDFFNLITFVPGENTEFKCDFEAMKSNMRFISNLANNIVRRKFYYITSFTEPHEKRQILLSTLAEKLEKNSEGN